MATVRLANGVVIDATDHHPFWAANRSEWMDAIDLVAGDVVVAADGRRLMVIGAAVRKQDLTAYNLTINDLHTYYAGDNPVLAHNSSCNPFDADRWLEGADPEDVLNAIHDNWIVTTPRNAVGEGIRFGNPKNASEVIIFESGTGIESR